MVFSDAGGCLIDRPSVDQIRQKLSVAAPEASAVVPKIAPDFSVSVLDDSRVSYLSFFYIF